MNYLLIPDKFKGSLTAKEVITSISNGIIRANNSATIYSVIASDGGDGFLDAVANNIDCAVISVETVDPLGQPIIAPYLLNKTNSTGYIEMAKASGLELLKQSERSALKTSSFGTGVQILDAIKNGAKTIYIGLGGSATNDAGLGIAMAFGYAFLDANGQALSPIGDNLGKVAKIHKPVESKLVDGVSIFAVNDVNNPLFGANGAAYVYAKQKGASNQEIKYLDHGLQHLNTVIEEQLFAQNALVPGAGAAGGAAFGLKTFFNAEFISGIDFLLELAQVSEIIKKNTIEYIITGEGKIDDQTSNGKLVKGVVTMAQKFNIPVIGVCGVLELSSEQVQRMGMQTAFQIVNPDKGVEYSIKNAALLVEDVIYNFFK